jgi:hypothetical protein
MVKRPGIGATTASAVIFSVLLVSNFAVYFASQDRARLYYQSNAEDLLSDNAQALVGAGATNLLVREQTFLESTVLPCNTADGLIASELAGFTDIQHTSDLIVSTSAMMASDGSVVDNLSMVAPFNGFVSGDFDTSDRILASGIDTATGVVYQKTEIHFVHIPARVQAAENDCQGVIKDISSATSSAIPANCTALAIAPILSHAIQSGTSKASRDGFTLDSKFYIIGENPCSISLIVSVDQKDVLGPSGFFNVRMQEETSVSFEQ